MTGREVELSQERQPAQYHAIADALAGVGRRFYERGWALGTSGNFSVMVSFEPFRLAITASGVNKSALTPDDVLQVDRDGGLVTGAGLPSAETGLHLTVVRVRGAASVLHTHSVWSTMLSEAFAEEGGLSIEGFEMLKGLAGVRSHEHREWLPVIENSQDIAALSRSLEEALVLHPESHGVLLRRHGLYTWGRDLIEAIRHVEILEFLLEVVGRTYYARGRVSCERGQ